MNILANYDYGTKEYVNQNVEDHEIRVKDFSVSAFNANSGHGSVFDLDLGRVIPFNMSRDVLGDTRSVFSWGLDQYANRTGGLVRVRFWRILAMDGRAKRYVILAADRAA